MHKTPETFILLFTFVLFVVSCHTVGCKKKKAYGDLFIQCQHWQQNILNHDLKKNKTFSYGLLLGSTVKLICKSMRQAA